MLPDSNQIEKFRKVAELAARTGGIQLLDWMGKFKITEKQPGDYVTQADFASQKVIRELLHQHFPNHGFLGEEEDEDENKNKEGAQQTLENGKLVWIVDPLDGTMNYIHGLNSFSVSVALVACDEKNGDQLLAACVFDPVIDECFTAGLHAGAHLNGTPIHVSRETELDRALLVCSFSTRVANDSPEIQRFLNLLSRAASIRRLGSAALNLCYVAAGRLDGYWASSIQAWDVAAGALILTEAGGNIVQLDGTPFQLRKPWFLASASQQLRERTLPWLQID